MSTTRCDEVWVGVCEFAREGVRAGVCLREWPVNKQGKECHVKWHDVCGCTGVCGRWCGVNKQGMEGHMKWYDACGCAGV